MLTEAGFFLNIEIPTWKLDKAVVMVLRLGGQDILWENCWVGKTYFYHDFALYVRIIGWAAAHPANPMTTPLQIHVKYVAYELQKNSKV